MSIVCRTHWTLTSCRFRAPSTAWPSPSRTGPWWGRSPGASWTASTAPRCRSPTPATWTATAKPTETGPRLLRGKRSPPPWTPNGCLILQKKIFKKSISLALWSTSHHGFNQPRGETATERTGSKRFYVFNLIILIFSRDHLCVFISKSWFRWWFLTVNVASAHHVTEPCQNISAYRLRRLSKKL